MVIVAGTINCQLGSDGDDRIRRGAVTRELENAPDTCYGPRQTSESRTYSDSQNFYSHDVVNNCISCPCLIV